MLVLFWFFLVLLSVLMIVEFLTMSDIVTDKCKSVHYHLPYKWEIQDGLSWRELSMMEEIEKAYCDPKNSRYSNAGLLAWSFVVEPV